MIYIDSALTKKENNTIIAAFYQSSVRLMPSIRRVMVSYAASTLRFSRTQYSDFFPDYSDIKRTNVMAASSHITLHFLL